MKSSHSQEKSPELNTLEVLARNKRARLITEEEFGHLLSLTSMVKINRAEIRGGTGPAYGEVVRVPEFVVIVNKIY